MQPPTAPTRTTLPTPVIIALLAAACWAPRWAMSARRDVICTDAVLYIERAEALRQGDFAAAMADLRLNSYPVLLAGLRGLGVEYESGGRSMSLLLATLTVWPMFLLVRGFWGPRFAMVACLLYAVHAESIEWSPEIIRDPLFWCLTWTALHASWRAVETRSIGWFAWAGAILSAAILTRFEGWLLALPLAIWTAGQWWRQPTAWRAWLACGAVAATMCPVLLLTLNLTALRGHDHWEWGRFDHLTMAARWLTGGVEHSSATVALPALEAGNPSNQTAAAEPPSREIARRARLSWRGMAWGYRHTLVRAWHPAWLALTLIGLATAASRKSAPEESSQAPTARLSWWPINALVVLFLASVWIYLWHQQETTKRYFLLPIYLTLPYAAAGVWWIAAATERVLRASRQLRELAPRVSLRWAVAGVVLLACGSLGVTQALSSRYEARARKADLGVWIAERFGPGRSLLCSENLERIVGYYARGRHRLLPKEVCGDEAADWLAARQPELVVLWQPDTRAVTDYRPLVERAERFGWAKIEGPAIDERLSGVVVLVSPDVARSDFTRSARSAYDLPPARKLLQ